MAGPRVSMGGGGGWGLEVGLGGEGEGLGEWLMERGRRGQGVGDVVVVVVEEGGRGFREEASAGWESLLVRSEDRRGA